MNSQSAFVRGTLVFALLSSGCGPAVLVPTSVAPDIYAQVVPTTDAPPTQLLVVADTHNSNPMSWHSTWSGSEFSDRLVTRVAIRPPQMDAWALKLLSAVLQRNPDQTVIHLGDAANLGCRRETKQFLSLMTTARPGRWYMAPGNHDSLAYGNWAGFGGKVERARNWVSDCANDGKPWANADFNVLETKDLLIDDYVEAQGWTKQLTVDVTTQSDRAQHNKCTELPPGGNPAAELRVHRCINQRADYKNGAPPLYISYLLQQVPIAGSDTVVVLIDTTEFVEFPRVGHTGGQQGGIRNDQLAVLETWLRDIAKAGKTAIVGGHFPIEMLDSYSRAALNVLFERYPVIAYFSAHTHDPTNLRMHGFSSVLAPTTAMPRVGLPEINVGSLLDWPMTYATVALPTRNQPTRLYLGVHDVPDELRCDIASKHPGTYADYSSHPTTLAAFFAKLRGGMNTAYAAARTKMYETLSKDLGLNPGLTADSELGEHATAITNPVVDSYETCQVRWASEEEQQTRQPLHWFDDPKIVRSLLSTPSNGAAGWYVEFLASTGKPRTVPQCGDTAALPTPPTSVAP